MPAAHGALRITTMAAAQQQQPRWRHIIQHLPQQTMHNNALLNRSEPSQKKAATAPLMVWRPTTHKNTKHKHCAYYIEDYITICICSGYVVFV